MACSATSSNFYLPPRYETPTLDVNISLNMANLCIINISAQHFHIWQHLGSNRSDMQLQHLTTIPSIPVHKIYQHLLNSTMSVVPFNTDSSENANSLWNLFTHPGIYVSAIGLIIPIGIVLFCCSAFYGVNLPDQHASQSHLQSLFKDHWLNHPKSRGCRNVHNFCCKT